MLGEAIRSILLADSIVSDLVGTRIYPLELPLKTSFPALTYSFPSDPFQLVMRSARCQINCWSDGKDILEKYTERETLKQAVENSLKFFTGQVNGVNIEITWPIGPYNHMKDSTSGFFFIPYDFQINYYT